MSRLFALGVLLYCFCATWADNVDLPQVDKSNWVDPNDFRFSSQVPAAVFDDASFSDQELSALQSALSSCRLELNQLKHNPAGLLMDLVPSAPVQSGPGPGPGPACVCSSDPTLLKHVIHRILIRLNLETKLDENKKTDYLYEANLRLSASDVRSLQKLLDTDQPDMNLIQDARLAMETFVRKARRVRAPDEPPGLWEKLWTNLSFYLQIGNLLVLLPAAALVLQHVSRISLRRLALYAFFVIFCLSCVWTWLHLYKVKQAERQARYAKIGVPRECFPEQQSAYQALTSYLGSLIHFPQSDECLQYYKDIMIDPYLEVAPTEAIAVTASTLILKPLGILGEHLANFIASFYSRLPLTVAPFATILLLIFGLFSMLLLFGYRIRLPLWLGVIEPGRIQIVNVDAPQSSVDNGQQQKRLQNSESSPNRARLTLRDEDNSDSQQLRRRASSRSLSLPRVANVNR